MPQSALKEGEASFTLTPEFLRDIVARHVFRHSAPAALRELIQNAHDACLVRCALVGTDDGTIQITLDPVEKTITIQDNGIGMTLDDIRDYLTTIGRGGSSKRNLAEKYGVPERNINRLANVIGEFGFGFIASFIIADEIEITTRSARTEGAKGIRCVFSTRGIGYKWQEIGEAVPTGTKLVLKLNREHSSVAIKAKSDPIEGSLLGWDTVNAIVKKYCSFLEYPIFVAMHGDPISGPSNQVAVPWRERQNLQKNIEYFYEQRFGSGKLGEIILTIPLDLSRDRGDEVTLEGVLVLDYAPGKGEVPSNLEIFVKRMWVCDHTLKGKENGEDFEPHLLPRWAAFLRGVIITPDLRPLPGRDDIDTGHESFDKAKVALHRIISEAFLEMAQRSKANFNRMLDRFGHVFRGGVFLEHERAEHEKRPLLEGEATLIRHVRFYRFGKKYPNGGPCTINEYLGITSVDRLDTKENRHVLWFVARPIAPNRQAEFRQLLTSQSQDVIVPEDETETAILGVANDVFPDLLVKNIEHDLLKTYAGLLEGDQRARWSLILKYFEALAESHKMKGAEVGALNPEYMPIVILNIPNAEAKDKSAKGQQPTKEQRDEIERDRQLKGAFVGGLPSKLAELFTQTLVINSRNPTMKALLDYKESNKLDQIDTLLNLCLHECYHLALLAALDSLPPEMLKHHVDWQCGVISEFVRAKSEQNNIEEQLKQRTNELATAEERLTEGKKTLEEEKLALITYKSRFGDIPSTNLVPLPTEPEERMAVVVFCNMIGATGSLIGMDFTDRGKLLKLFVDQAKKCIHGRSGFFDKFTGDGVLALFGLECSANATGTFSPEHWHEACEHAWMFSRDLEHAIIQLNSDSFIRSVVERNQDTVKEIRVRVGLHAGHVTFGNFGGTGTAVGPTVIMAARLCSESEAFIKAERSILCTEEFRSRSGRTDLQEVSYDFKPRGFNTGHRALYRPV